MRIMYNQRKYFLNAKSKLRNVYRTQTTYLMRETDALLCRCRIFIVHKTEKNNYGRFFVRRRRIVSVPPLRAQSSVINSYSNTIIIV